MSVIDLMKSLAGNLASVVVPVGKAGARFILREMTGSMRDEWDRYMSKRLEKEDDLRDVTLSSRARLVAVCLVDEDGILCCEKHGIDGVCKLVGSLSHKDQLRLFNEAEKLNFMDDKALDETIKNSSSDRNDGNGSGSQDSLDAVSTKPSNA